jgi:hypothetical protein
MIFSFMLGMVFWYFLQKAKGIEPTWTDAAFAAVFVLFGVLIGNVIAAALFPAH